MLVGFGGFRVSERSVLGWEIWSVRFWRRFEVSREWGVSH